MMTKIVTMDPAMSSLPDTYQTDEARWRAVLDRDPEADGVFFYSVRTTGVYCRPTCGAREPLRENVGFHETCEQAEAEGFRACKRCKPESGEVNRHGAMVEAACRWIEKSEDLPTLNALADKFGYSPYHFHRIFKRHTGVTPKAYGQAHRGQRIRSELRRRDRVTDAIYEAGYQASSRFYEEAGKRLGMTPSQYKKGGAGQTVRYTITECALGPLLIAATEKGVCLIHFGDSKDGLNQVLTRNFPYAALTAGDRVFNGWVETVLAAIAGGKLPDRELPLDIQGTAFQQKVWQALREIPRGRTVTYAELATAIGQPKAARAVGSACAHNDLAVLVPCHRVVRADGSLSGYRWGTTRKRELLERESNP